jgi:phosphatidylserine decarboxylase
MVLALSFIWFFRDPERNFPAFPDLLLSPADGVVHRFHEDGGTRTVEIFLRIWDVHIQRAPADGRVVSVRYTKGGYLPANVRDAGTRNTRCEMVFATSRGRLVVRQVAGLIARKVESWVRRGQRVTRGERIGIIHMGSQCRLTMPAGARILVKKGQKVYGGLTPLARLGRRGV